ncbi:MAG: sugar kinase [Actinoallomurus sp.]
MSDLADRQRGTRPVNRPDGPLDVVTIGETMVMFAPVEPVPLAQAPRLAMYAGGAESNVATYLAELGHHVRWAGRLGDDPFGGLILRELEDAGVDTRAVVRVPGGRTGVYVKDTHAGNTAVYYYRDRSAARGLTPDVLGDPLLDGARILHLSGITAAISDSSRAMVLAGVRERPDPSRLVSFDVNYRPGLWPAATAAPLLAEVADRSDLVFVGLDEARVLWGCRTPADVRAVLPNPGTVVVKDGEVGAYGLGSGGEVFVPSPRVRVVEPVGAGDAFAAGYLAAVLDGGAEEARLRFGHLLAAAALSVTSDHGSLPARALLRRHLEISAEDWARLDLSSGW